MMFGPVLWQINRVRVNRCVYRCVCTQRCGTKLQQLCPRGMDTGGFILFRPGGSVLQCV